MKAPSGGQEKNISRTHHKTVLAIIVSIIGAFIVLLPSNPSNMTLPSRDSGVFLYMGWRLMNGDIPYRDVWDHKPPLIYFLNALGLNLSPDSLWGVWSLQILFIFLTIFLTFRLLGRELGIIAGLAGVITLTSGLLTIIEKGNVTEEYALVFQVLCFLLFVSAWKKDYPIRSSVLIGILGGIAFNFKQTTIGIWMTYGLFLLAIRIIQRKPPFKDVLAFLAGWILPTFLVVIYLASQNALADYWEQAFLYNFVYIGKHQGIRRLVPVFIKGFAYLSNGWVLYLSILGWMAGIGCVWAKRREKFAKIHPLIWIALVNLPIEILFILISGRSILHYYLTPLPVMAILAGTLPYTIPILIARIVKVPQTRIHKWIPGTALVVIMLGQIGMVTNYPQTVRSLSDNDYVAVIEYIKNNTQAGDQILLIGAESVVNFLTRRESPTRYVYQYPLALLGRRPMFEEYFNEILENKPVLIVDTRGSDRLDDRLYVPMQKRSEIVRSGVEYLGENYRQVAKFGEWSVYRYSPK